MQRPSTTIGELEVKNIGQKPLKSSLRHSFFPLAASRQETVPRTPSVTTLPSATVGELRGPACGPPAGPVAGCASYLSCHTSFPVAASRQRMTSSPPSRVNTYSLSPTRAGVASPPPTVTFHFCVNSLGQVLGALNSAALASRLGPRHWGQSCPQTQLALASAR